MTDSTKDTERLALLERAKSIYHEACVMPKHVTVEVIADHLAAEIAAARREERELRALDEAVIEAACAYCGSRNSLGRLDSSLLHAMDRALAARDTVVGERGGEG
jgi:C4-dicarboxylate-specific signal transduction histidine kinase